jgi:dipeptidyl aminopeptidase/acylaminoacyl peptidase
LALAAGAVAGAAAAQRPVTPEDYFSLAAVGDPQLSPDGKLAVYTIARVDTKLNRRISEIWLVPVDGSAPPRALTGAPGATSPRWTPDGSGLAFLSTRPATDDPTPKAQVYLLSLHGGEARRLTHLAGGVSAFAWSPDGARLVCISRAGPPPAPTDTRHYFSSSYKFNGRSFFGTDRTHLWVVDVGVVDAASLAARQITSGDQRNDLDPQWSPDGKRIAFASERTDVEPGSTGDIWTVPAEGGEPVRIADRHESDGMPRWSPDGASIAYVASDDDDTPAIWIAPAGGGVSRPAVPHLEYVPATLHWRNDGAGLLFVAPWKGEQHLFSLDLRVGKIAPVTTGARQISAVSFSFGARRMAFTANDATHPDELFSAALDGTGERTLTRTNAELLGGLALSPIERVRYKSVDGWEIDGFLMKPMGWQEGHKYPMVLTIHGGPSGQYGVGWNHEFQGYASHGWAVFFTNPRGSSGYGTEFQRAVKLEWAGKAYDDIMRGVDAALAKNAWIDTAHLGVTGGSYGGFMTNWIVGHTTRFQAAVTLRSIANFTSVEGTRDAAYGHKRDFGGDLYQNFDLYWRYSPVRYAKDVKTPTLVLHSDDDQRVPLEQGEQWFRALQHFHVPSEFVIFPRENHELTRAGEPKHLVESLQWQIYWFERYLNGNGSARPPDAPRAAASEPK